MKKTARNRLVTDEKVTNFKMFKAKKKWIFASALMLSMMSAGMMGTYDAHADVVNPDTVMATDDQAANQASTAATTTVQSAAGSKASTSSASSTSAAPSSAVDAHSRKANKAETTSEAPTSTAASQAPSAAAKADSSATTASSTNRQSTTSSVSTDLAGVADNIGSTATADSKDDLAKSPLANDSAAKTADQAKKTDTNKKKQNDADVLAILKDVAEKSPRAGGEALANGTLEITGSGITGLVKNADGTYSGSITLEYKGSSIGIQFAEGSAFVIGVPAELRELFASPNFKQYITGNFKYTTFGGIIGDSWNYAQSDITIAADGSTISFANERSFQLFGKNVEAMINIDLGAAVTRTGIEIPISNSNYLFDSALVEGGSIIDWNVIGDYNAQAMLQTNNLMGEDQEGLGQPYVVQPVYDNSTTVTGIGEPGADVIVWNGDHTIMLGTGTVNSNGYYSVTIPPQTSGSTINVEQRLNGETSPSTAVIIQHAPEEILPPTIDRMEGGQTVVTGTGVPGNKVSVYDSNNVLLGYAYVQPDGTYSASLNRGLRVGEIISATQDNGRDVSDPATAAVGQVLSAPTIDQPLDGDTTVTGTGVPGNLIHIYDSNGNQIGVATVGTNGTYTAPVPELEEGQVITATQVDADGNESAASTATVGHTAFVPQPGVDRPKDGDTVITGTGVPGDYIIIRDSTSSQIGSAYVQADGTYTAELSRPLVGGEQLGIFQGDGANISEPTITTVAPATQLGTPTINATSDGDKVVTGTGEPGATVLIYDSKNNVLGAAVVDANGLYSAAINRALIGGETIYAGQTLNGQTSDRASSVVTGAELMPPTVVTPKDGAEVVTGVGEPGATVIIYDANNNILGAAIVDANGNYSVPVNRPLVGGETIYAGQMLNGKESDRTASVVQGEELGKPVLDTATDGDTSVSGEAEPGATILVYDSSNTLLGAGVADANGHFSVTLNRPLVGGETVGAEQIANGQQSDRGTTVVQNGQQEVTTPTIDVAKGGTSTVGGTADPNATVIVYDANGDIIGAGIADATGHYTITTIRPLVAGETIFAGATLDGQESERGSKVVDEGEVTLDPPTISVAVAGTTTVSGTAKPGSVVMINDANGVFLGAALTNSAGNFTVEVNRPLEAGETIYGNQTLDGVQSENGSKVVDEGEVTLDPPTISVAEAGTTTVSGTAKPGSVVMIYDADGIFLGAVQTDTTGNFTIEVNRPLVAGETIYGNQTLDGVQSENGSKVVEQGRPAPPTATISSTTGLVTGVGEPGATIVIYGVDGTKIAEVTAGADGSYSWEVPSTTASNTVFLITQIVNGVESDRTAVVYA